MAFDQNKPATGASLVSSDIRNNFEHLKNAFMVDHNWNYANPAASTHKSIAVPGSTQRDTFSGYDNSTGSGNIATDVHHVNSGIAAGTYTLQELLQALVARSHSHTVTRVLSNCNCHCNCEGSSK